MLESPAGRPPRAESAPTKATETVFQGENADPQLSSQERESPSQKQQQQQQQKKKKEEEEEKRAALASPPDSPGKRKAGSEGNGGAPKATRTR